ncbi:UNVERIFIED_CONTAM: hypothetical protein K2H54_011639 [Gekko kuhli]
MSNRGKRGKFGPVRSQEPRPRPNTREAPARDAKDLMVEGRGGVVDSMQRFSSLPVYLPASHRVSGAEVSFFLKETNQDIMRNASLQSRTESFLLYQAAQLPVLNVTYGPFTLEQTVPPNLLLLSAAFWSADRLTFNWKLRSRIIDSAVFSNRPRVQALFYVAGKDWEDEDLAETLPCVQMAAFQEERVAVSSCRLKGHLGLCVARLEFPPSWFDVASPSSLSPLDPEYQPAMESSEGNTVELLYRMYEADGECSSGDQPSKQFLRSEGPEEAQAPPATMGKIGSVVLYPTRGQLKKALLSLDDNLVLSVPLRPVKEGDLVTFHVSLAAGSRVDQFTLR